MKKPITNEMLQAMSLDQLKTLQKNAKALDTPAALQVLDLIEQSGLLTKSDTTARKAPAKRPVKRKPKAEADASAAKPIRASFGRQA